MQNRSIRSKDEFLVFGSPALEEAEIQGVVASLKSGWLGTDAKVAQFENDFRAYKGTEYAVAVSSCTAALHLSILAAQLKLGDEVITTAMTFCATINAIMHAGVTLVLMLLANSENLTPQPNREQGKGEPEDYPNAMRIGRQTVSLALSAKLTHDDVEDVIKAVKRVLSKDNSRGYQLKPGHFGNG